MTRINPKASIVIRCLNEEAHLYRLFQGIHAQTEKDVEVILVDSGSTDASTAIAESFGARIVHIQPSEFTFGRSLNLGCEAATGEFIVIVSAHVYPVNDTWLESLLAPFSDPDVALTYGMQRGNETSHFSEHRVFRKWFPMHSDMNQAHPFCNNANAAIRRSQWEGRRYNEALTGLEDLDWAKRAQQAGGKIAYVAEAPIIHVHNESWAQVANRYRREAIAYTAITGDRGVGLIRGSALWFAHIASDAAQAILLGRWRALGSIVRFRTAQSWGTYLGAKHGADISKDLRQRFYYPALPAGPRTLGNMVPGRRIDYTRVQPVQDAVIHADMAEREGAA